MLAVPELKNNLSCPMLAQFQSVGDEQEQQHKQKWRV